MSLRNQSPYDLILAPHITEKSMSLSLGDPRIREEANLVRKYTFLVRPEANKIQIKAALEAIYNDGRKDADKIEIANVRTIKVLGKKRRRGKSVGYESDRKKAIITLRKGQRLEDYGV
ncbi:MAG: 50S ribosomal protein L23 [Armatimonadota bacterium]